MATVIVYPADLSAPQLVPLDRRVMRFGSADDNDVRLTGGEASEHHAHILYEGKQFSLATTDGSSQTTVNGNVSTAHWTVVTNRSSVTGSVTVGNGQSLQVNQSIITQMTDQSNA